MNLWKPMLAAKPKPEDLDAEIAKLKFPLAGQLKLDGIRATVQNGVLYSRSLKPIPNRAMQKLWGRPDLEGLDGEIIVGPMTAPDCFHHTQSFVMSKDKTADDAVFHVFDTLDDVEPFVIRNNNAKLTVDEFASAGLKHLDYTELKNLKALEKFEGTARAKGHEGVIARPLHSGYKQGRSTMVDQWLVAIKRTVDAEAVVLAVYEQEENTNVKAVNELGKMKRSSHKAGKVGKNTLGGFMVMMEDMYRLQTGLWSHKTIMANAFEKNLAFGIGTGTGLTDALRKELWAKRKELPGKIVKFRYQKIGTMDLPRQPIFLGFRSKSDM